MSSFLILILPLYCYVEASCAKKAKFEMLADFL